MGTLVVERQAGKRLYRLFDTGDSSHKFGPCEVCGKYSGTVYHLVTLTGDAYLEPDKWGCRECLEATMGDPEAPRG